MSKYSGETAPKCEITSTDLIKYTGEIPECLESNGCEDVTLLNYLIKKLLDKYCEVQTEVIDYDLSSIDLACVIEANPDIEIPGSITVGTILEYYRDNICSLYSKISDFSILICSNDIVQLDQNSSLNIDILFNDYLVQVSGTAVVSIITPPLNGVAVRNVDNTITYTPSTDFFGNDSLIYKVVKGEKECTAKVTIKVNKVITEEDISDIVTTEIVNILQSNEYWDLGLPKGTKMGISQENLVDFILTGSSWGAGKANTKWTKWAICNGNNATEDHKQSTLRGFDINDSDYDASAEAGGSDSLTLTASNLPAHKHTYDWILTHNVNGRTIYEGLHNTNIPTSSGEYAKTVTELDAQAGSNTGDDAQCYYEVNTGDATDNIDGEGEVSNDVIDIRNAFTTLVLVQKIA